MSSWIGFFIFVIMCLLIDLSIKLAGIRAELKKSNIYLANLPFDDKSKQSAQDE